MGGFTGQLAGVSSQVGAAVVSALQHRREGGAAQCAGSSCRCPLSLRFHAKSAACLPPASGRAGLARCDGSPTWAHSIAAEHHTAEAAEASPGWLGSHDAVEDRPLVVQGHAALAHALLAGAQRAAWGAGGDWG